MAFGLMQYVQQCKWTIKEAASVTRVDIERSDAPLYVVSGFWPSKADSKVLNQNKWEPNYR